MSQDNDVNLSKAFGIPDDDNMSQITVSDTVSGILLTAGTQYEFIADIDVHRKFSTTADADTNDPLYPAGQYQYYTVPPDRDDLYFSVVRDGTSNGNCWVVPMTASKNWAR